jgi:hypothetical protein
MTPFHGKGYHIIGAENLSFGCHFYSEIDRGENADRISRNGRFGS